MGGSALEGKTIDTYNPEMGYFIKQLDFTHFDLFDCLNEFIQEKILFPDKFKKLEQETFDNFKRIINKRFFVRLCRRDPHFSIQLEPFLKMPLGGVGYGKVQLFTTGALLSAKYHFLKNHKLTQ